MMQVIPKFLIILFLAVQLNAQNLDSLYNVFLSMYGFPSSVRQVQNGEISDTEKCGTRIISQIRFNIHNFNPEKQKKITMLLSRPVLDTSFVTPNGKFRIHFNKSDYPDYIPENICGSLTVDQIPRYKKIYLDSLAIAVDSAYNYEINILKYPAPPSDNGAGGDNLYDIYIQNLSGGLYGYTDPETPINDSTYITYIMIDNDFSSSSYYTKRIDAARVTVAHELHHAIQMGNYVYRLADSFYYEITSTSMEEFVYSSINDYYYSLISYFLNPAQSFASSRGYNLAIWNIFLADRFGMDIIKRIWELMKLHNRALIAIGNAIQEYNSSFKIEFNRFGQWIYFTNFRAKPGSYFKEAANYPLVKPAMSPLRYDQNKNSLMINTNPVSLNLLYFYNNIDTMVSVISNADLNGGIHPNSNTLGMTYSYSSSSFSGSRTIIDGFYSLLETTKPELLSESDIFNYVPVDSGIVQRTEAEFVYPQPFKYSMNSFLYFPVSKDNDGYADLNIYSVSMTLVYSSHKRIQAIDKYVVGWDGMDNKGNKLPTGVYLFITKSGDNIKKGKFIIYND